LDNPDSRVYQDFLVTPGHLVDRVTTALLGRMDLMVWMESRDCQDHLEIEESRERTEPPEYKDCQVPRDLKGTLDLLDSQDTKVPQESRETQVFLDRKDLEDTVESLDHRVMLVCQDPWDPRDRRV